MRLVALMLVASLSVPAAAQTTEDAAPRPLSATFGCLEILEDAARLACYDGAVSRLREAEAQGHIVALDRAQAEATERDAFGLPDPSISVLIPGLRDEGDEQTDRIEMQVERVVQHVSGRHRFVMANGQVWVQVEPQPAHNVRPGDTIIVRRGALGSFLLSPRHGAAHRVRRDS